MLKTGFNRTIITPPLGTAIEGYFVNRIADKILDDLEVNTIAFEKDRELCVLLVMDLCQIRQVQADVYRKKIASKLGIKEEAVFIQVTHTHTGPFLCGKAKDMPPYDIMLGEQLTSSAMRAVEDLKESKVSFAYGKVDGITFIRRYRMKDGTIKTNPGLKNPDIVEPIGEADEMLSLIKIERQGSDIAIVNFAVHPDSIGGNNISAEYPRYVRETMESCLDNNLNCVFILGHCGDLNHLNPFPTEGEMKIQKPTYPDSNMRGYQYTKHMGRAIAAEALRLFDITEEAKSDTIKFMQKVVEFDSNMPTSDELEQAEEIVKIHSEGRDSELPWKDMELTTNVAEALRMVNLKDGPEKFKLNLSVFAVGDAVFAGVPGELFCEMGRRIRDESSYPMTINMYLCNGGESYFPTKNAYDEGGYEARSCYFGYGTAEALAEELSTMIKSL